MRSYPVVRGLVRITFCFAASLAITAPFATSAGNAADNKVQAQAQLLDHAEFLCDNCLFGASNYYYCLAAGDTILAGYQKTPVLNWQDPKKNYLTPAHPSWTSWNPPSQTVSIEYNGKNIWVTRGNSKTVKLKRSPLRDIFANDARCRQAPR
jgi:hypothetical protein